MLKPGGTLVAICADGPRQREALEAESSYWYPLPSGTFAGTGVASRLLVIDKPEVVKQEQRERTLFDL